MTAWIKASNSPEAALSSHALLYYFSVQSPWSYLGHADMVEVTRRHGLQIVWQPVNLLAIFSDSGGLPLAKRHPKRQAYRDIELQRWRLRRNLPLNPRPAFWPVNIHLVDCAIIALVGTGADPDRFVRAAFAALWVDEADLADMVTVEKLLTQQGYDGSIVDAARTPEIAAIYDEHTRAALDDGVFGAPTYIFAGEPFWGQDRIALLDDALESGRPPFLL